MSGVEKRGSASHNVTGIFIFFLIGLFAVLAVTLTVIGVRAYSRVSDASVNNSNGQVALSYILNKVHAGDAAVSCEEGAESFVALRNMEGTDVLCIGETSEFGTYWTYIYYADGALREIYTGEDESFADLMELGSVVCELNSIRFEQVKPWLIRITAEQTDGKVSTLHLSLRGGEAAEQ